MLLKYSQSEKRTKISGNGKQQRGTGNMKLIVGSNALNTRLPRKSIKGFATKRPASHLRSFPVTSREDHRTPVDASDNSNDSGLGFDQHLDASGAEQTSIVSDHEVRINGQPESKRKRMDLKVESDDANDNFSFSQAMNRSQKLSSQTGGLSPDCVMSSRGNAGALGLQRPLAGTTGSSGGAGGGGNGVPRNSSGRLPQRPTAIMARRAPGPVSLSSNLMAYSRDGRVQLHIASQPEQQHRARYQTEGSRGAVKDRSGNGFPVVKLIGYNKPATLQVFIGTDMGRVAPHMFYQACKVSGKNSTPCNEKKIDGTIVIEVDFDPAKDMTITCDCVGILKERNVDVEHRFPDQSGTRNKKKSTRCRMVFRTTISHPDGSSDILQTSSHPIVCTQPPGVPEISKKSLSVCPCTGGMELFILGKNFLKDTRVVFQQNDSEPVWEETVQPDKEFLQQTHLVCTVPAYQRCDILEPVTVRLLVTSSGKTSEPHSFTYMPATNPVLQSAVGTSDITQSCLNLVSSGVPPGCIDLNRVFSKSSLGSPSGLILPGTPSKSPATLLPTVPNHFLPVDIPHARLKKDVQPVRLWGPMSHVGDTTKTENVKSRDAEQNKVLGLKMMPPPPLLPLPSRRTSSNILIIPDADPPMPATQLKTEILDESSQGSNQLSPEDLKGIDLRMKPVAAVVPMATVSDLLSTQSPSLATFRRFVSNPSDTPLPTQSGLSVEKYLSHIENPTVAKARGTTVTTPSEPTLPGLSKLCNSDKTINSQFNAPIMFDTSQASNTSLLTPNATSNTETNQKVPFVTATAIPSIYSSSTPIIVEKKVQKPQLVEQAAIQANLSPDLLAVGLNAGVSGNQSKSKYQETSLSGLCSGQTLPSTLITSIPGPILSAFPSSVSTSTEFPSSVSTSTEFPSSVSTSTEFPSSVSTSTEFPSSVSTSTDFPSSVSTSTEFPSSVSTSVESPSLSVPTILKTIAETSRMIENDTSLIFNSSQPPPSKSLVPSTEVSQKADERLLDNKHGNQPSPNGVLGTTHISPPLAINGNILAVTDAQSTLMTGSSNSGITALVSSAIESQIIEANQQAQTSEKLDFISPSGNIITAVSSENSVIESSTPVTLNDNLVPNQNSTSPIHVQDITLNSTVSASSLRPFSLDTLSATQPSGPINPENLILSNSVTSTFNEHVLNPGSTTKTTEAIVLNPVNEQSLALDSHIVSSDRPRMMLSNSTCTSPIAIKNIMLGSTNTGDNDLSNTTPSQSSQISGKSIISSPTIEETEGCLSSTSCTSPMAIKTMILRASSEVNETPIMSTAMKDILAPNTVEEMSLCTRTSPIGIKKMIFESTSMVRDVLPDPSQQTVAVKKILNAGPADNSLLTSVPSVPLSSNKLEVLVDSTVNKHILTSSVQSPPTSNLSLEATTCSPSNSLTLTTQSLATILGSSIPSNLTSSISLDVPSSVTDQREMHSSANSMETPNTDLTTPQSLPSTSPAIVNSQARPVTESSLMTMFPAETDTTAKNQGLKSVPATATTCSSLLDHQLNRMFGEQTEARAHPLLSPNQDNAVHHTLNHSIPFPSTSSNNSDIIINAPCSALSPKLNNIRSCTVPEGHEQARLINQVLMELGSGENGKGQINETGTVNRSLPKTVENSEYAGKGVENKSMNNGNIKSSSSAATNLDVVQVVHMQQQQEKQREQKELVTSSALPVPVTEIPSSSQTTKCTVPVVPGPLPKKLEEGMVPQELTQMSESDLLSYINPSCFDQV